MRQEQVNGQLQHQKRYVFFQDLCERAKVFTDVLCIIMCVEGLNNQFLLLIEKKSFSRSECKYLLECLFQKDTVSAKISKMKLDGTKNDVKLD